MSYGYDWEELNNTTYNNTELIEADSGRYIICWPLVKKIVVSSFRARYQFYDGEIKQDPNDSNIYSLEVNWDNVNRKAAEATYKELSNISQQLLNIDKDIHRTARWANRRLKSLQQRGESDMGSFFSNMRRAQQMSMSYIERSVEQWGMAITAAKHIRDISASTLMLGATIVSGGTATAALVGAGAFGKGFAKWQDTDNLGAAALKMGGEIVFFAVPKGHDIVVIVCKSGLESVDAIIQGKSVQEVAAAGLRKAIVEVAGKGVGALHDKYIANMLDKLAIPAVAQITFNSTDVSNEVLKGVEKIAAKKVVNSYLKKDQQSGSGAIAKHSSISSRKLNQSLLDIAIINADLGTTLSPYVGLREPSG